MQPDADPLATVLGISSAAISANLNDTQLATITDYFAGAQGQAALAGAGPVASAVRIAETQLPTQVQAAKDAFNQVTF